MSENMLMCFDSPINPPPARPMAVRLGSPLIPCPTLPFDCVAEAAAVESDPFEKVYKVAMAQQKTPTAPRRLKLSSLPASPNSPKLKGIPGDSELDISAALTGRMLISSTPNVASSSRVPDPDPSTPTSAGRRGAPKHRAILEKKIMEMSADHLKMIVKKKMERLEALNRNLTSFTTRPSNLRRSLSTSDLLPRSGKREDLNLSQCWDSYASNEDIALQSSFLDESYKSQRECTIDLNPAEAQKLKGEALKLSSFFQQLTVSQDDGLDDTLEEPIKERTIRRISKSYSGRPTVADDILLEKPPWDWSASSSEDEDGLPKLRRFRLSSKSEANNSPGVSSIVSRYRKTRSSLQLDKEPLPEVQQPPAVERMNTQATNLSQTSGQVSGTSDTKCDSTLVAASQTVVMPAVPQQPLLPEATTKAELKLKNAGPTNLKKGPLKAVVPLPNMVKIGVPSKLNSSKNTSVKRSPSVPNSQSPRSETSQLSSRGRDKQVSVGSSRRSNSSSALLRKPNLLKPPPLKLKAAVDRPESAPSPCRGILDALPSRPTFQQPYELDLISEEEMGAAIEGYLEFFANRAPVAQLPVFGRFELDALSDDQARQIFRFEKQDIAQLLELLHIPAEITVKGGKTLNRRPLVAPGKENMLSRKK